MCHLLVIQKSDGSGILPEYLNNYYLNFDQKSNLTSVPLNTQNMTNSTLVSLVKMEYGGNFSISGLRMMMKSGLGKLFLKFLHALTMSFLLLNFDQKYKFSSKNNTVSAWRNFKTIFHRPLFIIIFRPEMLKFPPYSILTRDTRVELVIYCVLKR